MVFLFLGLLSFSLSAEVSLPEFKKLVSVFHQEFDQELKARKSIMIINNAVAGDTEFWWKMDRRHAAYSSSEDDGVTTHFLFLFGGYARIPGMTVEGVAMTLCHELGHGIGGDPKKDCGEKSCASVEGQADYFAAKFCIKRILKHLPVKSALPLNSYLEKKCLQHFKTKAELEMCHRSFRVLENERLFFRTQEGIATETFYDRPDRSVTDQVNHSPYFYPEAQCRLDTMMNGLLGLERPACWWKR